ncbi:hypothetical protein QCA50_019378 [Cerrena zonata]|uniref:Uncharacterized protein n=1 Tax=Cerrena zonata TaxID=2478898 RepID=A0AAW0FEQ4_9APHY
MPPPLRTESYNALSPGSKRARTRAERKVEEAAKDQQLIEAGSGTRPSKTKLLADPVWLKVHGTKRGHTESDGDSDGSGESNEDIDRSTPKKPRKKPRKSPSQQAQALDRSPNFGLHKNHPKKRPAQSTTSDPSEDEQRPPKKQKRKRLKKQQAQPEINEGEGDKDVHGGDIDTTMHDEAGTIAMSPGITGP